MVSTEVKKLRIFPTKAIPEAPKKIATTLEEINPVKIFRITLRLFKDVILNKEVFSISFLKINAL